VTKESVCDIISARARKQVKHRYNLKLLSKQRGTLPEKFEEIMAEEVFKIQGLLVRLNENVAQLQASFRESVEEQVKMSVTAERRKLRKKFKAEQEKLLHETMRERSKTEELFTDISRNVRQSLEHVKVEKDGNLKAVTRKEKLKNSRELKEAIKETRSDTIAKLSSCSQSQLMEISENPDLLLTWSPRCASCGRESERLSSCEACQITRYCDEHCQAADWERHQNICAGLN